MNAYVYPDNDGNLVLHIEPSTTSERTLLRLHAAELGLVQRDSGDLAWKLQRPATATKETR